MCSCTHTHTWIQSHSYTPCTHTNSQAYTHTCQLNTHTHTGEPLQQSRAGSFQRGGGHFEDPPTSKHTQAVRLMGGACRQRSSEREKGSGANH